MVTLKLQNGNFVTIQSIDFVEEIWIPKFMLIINNSLTLFVLLRKQMFD